jgi:ElaB/YqjD/DUF883 family membrane-anchored ribosome-binding protein
MANTDTPAEQTTDVEAITRRFEEAMSSHRQATETEIAKMRREMEDMLSKAQQASASSLASLQEAIEDAAEFVAGERKSREERDRVVESESTLVVPPDDVLPPPPEEGPEQAYGDQPTKKGRLKGLW